METDAQGDRFERVQEVFREALSARTEDLDTFLDRRCGGDRRLRRQVEALLAAHREAGSFLEEGPSGGLGAAAGLAGRTVGAYRIVRRIGGGGMGVVYLAERADDAYRQRVAIKVLRPGEDSEAIIRRFTTERQILAGLDHPNIAKLVDGGATEDGLPYIAMEYVEGKPIDAYCDDRRLDVRARLELFLTLCDAVGFAHSNLVVHRDLKPGNVLITGDGRLKLLDFGIAKLLNPALTVPESRMTMPLLAMLTPDYASPEQVQGGAITTATDVYSLGVLLYRLLAGRAPYRTDPRAPAEMLEAICHRTPEPPSVAVARPQADPEPAAGEGGAGEDAPERRPGDVARLRRALAGDLDAIVAKALRKTPEQRYSSVAALAEDLRRHLQGLPVRARRGTLVYRTGKFARRYRWPLAAAGLLLVAMIGFGARLAWERDRSEAALAVAEVERERAEQLVEFLITLLGTPNPRTEPGDTGTAKEMLERAAEKLMTELEGQPEVRARAQSEIGEILAEVGDHELASRLLEKAIEVQEAPAQERELARSYTRLASVRIRQGELAEAEALLRRADVLLRRLGQEPDQDLAAVQHELGVVSIHRGRNEEGDRFIEQALAMHRAAGGNRVDEAQMMNTLGVLRQREGKPDEAEAIHRQVLAIRLSLLGPDHLTVSETQNNLATLLIERGEAAEARELCEAALFTRRRIFGPTHGMVATSWHNLGAAQRDLGEPAEAERAFRRAMEIYDQAVGRDHPYYAGSSLRLATVLEDRGQDREAASLYRDSIAVFAGSLGERHVRTAEAELYLARLMARRGSYPEALELADRALEVLEEKLGAGHWHVAAAQTVRAACLVGRGNASAGLELARSHLPRLEAERSPLARRFRDDARRLIEDSA